MSTRPLLCPGVQVVPFPVFLVSEEEPTVACMAEHALRDQLRLSKFKVDIIQASFSAIG